MPCIAIRADGNSQIGLGHIHRTLALANYLKDYFSITFYLYQADKLVSDLITEQSFLIEHITASDYNQPENFIKYLEKNTIIVLDGYLFKTDYQKAIKAQGYKLVVIDDLNEWLNVADVVINHAFTGNKTDYKISHDSILLGGLKFAIIKQELFTVKRHTARNHNLNVLVCIGGTDPDNYSERIIKELLSLTNKNISLLTYPLNKKFNELKKLAEANSNRLTLHYSLDTNKFIELIQNNEIAILQPSNIALEAAAFGIYISLVQTAENQKHIKQTLLDSFCASNLDLNNISESVNNITVNKINEQISNQVQLLDGKSSYRYIILFNQLFLTTRKVNAADVRLIYDWNNNQVTRANSYNQNSILFEDHHKWFMNKIIDVQSFYLMIEFDKNPAGFVRIDEKTEENVIGITVAPKFRGKKLATPMLNVATAIYFKYFPEKVITAYIKKTNEPSLKCFVRSGFKVINEGNYFGEWSYKLNMKLHE